MLLSLPPSPVTGKPLNPVKVNLSLEATPNRVTRLMMEVNKVQTTQTPHQMEARVTVRLAVQEQGKQVSRLRILLHQRPQLMVQVGAKLQ